jgi:hypothetical protein
MVIVNTMPGVQKKDELSGYFRYTPFDVTAQSSRLTTFSPLAKNIQHVQSFKHFLDLKDEGNYLPQQYLYPILQPHCNISFPMKTLG